MDILFIFMVLLYSFLSLSFLFIFSSIIYLGLKFFDLVNKAINSSTHLQFHPGIEC